LIKLYHQEKKKGRTLSSGILVSNPKIKKKSKKNPTIRKFSKKDESSNPVIKKNKRKAYYQEFKFWEPCHQEPQFLILSIKMFWIQSK
jgi:hypothetical protein